MTVEVGNSLRSSVIGGVKDMLKSFTPSGREEILREIQRQETLAFLMTQGNDKEFQKLMKDMGGHAWYDEYNPANRNRQRATSYNGIYQPRDKLSYEYRDHLAIDCSTLRIVYDKKMTEVNRKGLGIFKSFVRKCTKIEIPACENPQHEEDYEKGIEQEGCDQCPDPNIPLGQEKCEEEYSTNVQRCNRCGFPTRPPKLEHKNDLQDALMRGYVNKKNDDLLDICFHTGLDVEKHDNGFGIMDFFYSFGMDGEIKHREFIQMYRGNPAITRPVHSIDGSLQNNYYTCVMPPHRDLFKKITNEQLMREGKPRCEREIEGTDEVCGVYLQPVTYVQIESEYQETVPKYCYIEGEVFHVKKYYPTGIMGISKMDSLYWLIVQNIGMEQWSGEYYNENQMFNGFLVIPQQGTMGDTQAYVQAEFDKKYEDNNYIPIFIQGKDAPDPKYLRIDNTPNEMKYIEVLDRVVRTLATAHGVSNVHMNDTSTGTGLNNEGIDILVSNREIEWHQNVMDRKLLKPACASILNCDIEEIEYYIGYNVHEEQDEMAELQREATMIANARAQQELGFDITKDEDGKIIATAPVQGMPVTPLNQQSQEKKPYQDVEGMNEEGQSYEARSQDLGFSGSPNMPNVSQGGSELTTKQEVKPKIKRQEKSNGKEAVIELVNGRLKANHTVVIEGTIYNKGQFLPNITDTKLAQKYQKHYVEDHGDEETDYYTFTREIPKWKHSDDPNWRFEDNYEFVEFRTVPLSELNFHPDFKITDEDVENNSPRVRPMTLIHYLTETNEMDPIATDSNQNVLDGHHRAYCCEKKDQTTVTIAVFRVKEGATILKEQLKAPEGGVTINGTFYPGGQFIPGDTAEELSDEEREAVREGRDVVSVQDNNDKKGTKTLNQLIKEYGDKSKILQNKEALQQLKFEEWHGFAEYAYNNGYYSTPLQKKYNTNEDIDNLIQEIEYDKDNAIQELEKIKPNFQEWKAQNNYVYFTDDAEEMFWDEYQEWDKDYQFEKLIDELSDINTIEDIEKHDNIESILPSYKEYIEDIEGWGLDELETPVELILEYEQYLYEEYQIDKDKFLEGKWNEYLSGKYEQNIEEIDKDIKKIKKEKNVDIEAVRNMFTENKNSEIYTTPISIDNDTDFYHGTDVLDAILETGTVGINELYITTKEDTAEKYGGEVIKMKRKSIGDIYLDPDIWHPSGWISERENMQYIDGSVSINNIEGIYTRDATFLDELGYDRDEYKEDNRYFVPREILIEYKEKFID